MGQHLYDSSKPLQNHNYNKDKYIQIWFTYQWGLLPMDKALTLYISYSTWIHSSDSLFVPFFQSSCIINTNVGQVLPWNYEVCEVCGQHPPSLFPNTFICPHKTQTPLMLSLDYPGTPAKKSTSTSDQAPCYLKEIVLTSLK